MKKLAPFAALFASVALTPSANAAPLAAPAAQVQRVVLHETQLNGPDWFSLVNVTTLGACPKFQGQVIFSIGSDERGKRQLSALTSALLSGKNVIVQVDDTALAGGFCRARAIDLVR